MALDRLQARADRQELAVVTDRERIARDLHDVVIQRLFATGMQLQGIRAKAGSAVVQERLDQAVLDLDTTIRDIRTTIFELQYAESGPVSFRQAAHLLVAEYRTGPRHAAGPAHHRPGRRRGGRRDPRARARRTP